MSEQSRREAYEDGQRAFRAGDPDDPQDYAGGPSDEFDEWRRGWRDAQRRRAKDECGCALCEPGYGRKDKYCEVNRAWPAPRPRSDPDA